MAKSEQLIPDVACRRELGVGAVTWHRMEHGRKDRSTPAFDNFPDRVKIRNRNYRKRSQWEPFKAKLIASGTVNI
jgi:hypothetical protein